MVYLSRMGMGGISYLTTSILWLLEIMPHCGIFVMIGGGRIKLSDQFYSAPSRIYSPIWYICQEWGWGKSYLTTSFLPLRKIMPHYGTFVKIK